MDSRHLGLIALLMASLSVAASAHGATGYEVWAIDASGVERADVHAMTTRVID